MEEKENQRFSRWQKCGRNVKEPKIETKLNAAHNNALAIIVMEFYEKKIKAK